VFFHRSKKGNAVLETLVIIIVVVVLAIGSLFSYVVFSDLNDDIQSDLDLSNTTKNMTQNLVDIQPVLLDNVLLFVFVMFIIGVIVSVFLLDTHPIFFFINVVLVLCMLAGSLLLANATDDIFSDASLSTYAAEFPFTTWVMTHLLSLSVALSFLILIALFVKVKKG